MAKTKTVFGYGKRGEFDKEESGGFRDKRKARQFFVEADKLKTRTVLPGIRKTIFMDRYSMRDKSGKAMEEYPEQMWRRVAAGISLFEPTKELQDKWERRFYRVMRDFKFVPGGRILSGAGTGFEVTFFNCYVLPSPADSRGGIMENITQTVEVQARAGGVGINLSSLRPRGARVKKVNGISSGPVNWASLYSSANHDVIQQGGSRRGALMLMLADWHPDVEEFVRVKEDLSKIPGANLSVAVSDKFMEAVKSDGDWELVFPDLDDPEYDEVWGGDLEKWRGMGKKVKVYKTVKARDVWNRMMEAAWRSAEPGVVFLDRYNKMSNTWYFEKIVCVNPCGEQGLGEWGVCNLGSMNLSAYVDGEGKFLYQELAKDVRVAMRFMDNVVDANFYFYEENERSQKNIRRTGLGTMGLADALIKMKIRYGSEKSLVVVEKIYKTIRDSAYRASVGLAVEKGSFPKFEASKYLEGEFIRRLPKQIREDIAVKGIRNAVILTQAPTGTTSLLVGVSSGIEPNYDFKFVNKNRMGEMVVYHPLFASWKEAHEDEKRPAYFVSAKELTPGEHLQVQAKVQEYTDSSISKTVNAPSSYTVDDVKDLYMAAYDLGCKGVTFFRDGSRTGALESVDDDKKQKIKSNAEEGVATLRVRPKQLTGKTYQVHTPVGNAFVTINTDEQGNLFEVFVNVGKAGTHLMADAEALGRLISLSLRIPSKLSASSIAEAIVDQLAGIGGADSVGFGNGRVRSLADGVAKTIRGYLEESEKTRGTNGRITNSSLLKNKAKKTDPVVYVHQEALPLTSSKRDLCPECGQATLVMEEGCMKCYGCGVSKC